MPRPRSAPRLYLDPKRRQWLIRDGQAFVRTGCAESDVGRAEQLLAEYLGSKHQPTPSATPPIADILIAYGREHVPHKRTPRKIDHTIRNLARWWADKMLTDVTARNCRAYAAARPKVAARRDLETLRAAIRYWHKEYGPLPAIPFVTLPAKPAPRERWLTRSEAARLLWAARRVEHLRRFILIGLYTGSRARAILDARWRWVNWDTGVMRRRAPETAETSKRTPWVRIRGQLGKKGNLLAHMRRWAAKDAAPEGPIINYRDGGITHLKRSWNTAVEAAGLDGRISPHTLRHTRATWLMQSGTTIWDAAQSLGMSAIVLEKTYGHHHLDYQE
jgi:integrase